MKKLFLTMMLAVALIVVGGQTNKAEAYEIYCGTFRDGYDAYLLTETVVYTAGGGGHYNCTVRAVKGSSSFYIYYLIFPDSEGWHYRNSQGFSGLITSRTPVVQNILNNIR